MPAWEPDFDVYFALVDGAPASFMLDLAASLHVPLESHTMRLQVRVAMKIPRDDGLRDGEELEPLGELEDAIAGWLESEYDAIYVGHLITEGAVHIVAYAPAERVEGVEDLLEGFDSGDYELGWLVEEDPEWGMYVEFMFPDVYAMQVIQNRRLMNARAEHGDDPSLAHAVDHSAAFATQEQAESAAKALEEAGFAIESSEYDEEHECWNLAFAREDRLDGDNPDAFCVEIIDLLEPFEGDYMGWGAMILRSPETTN
jgi:regulator of RNase E activity RraB